MASKMMHCRMGDIMTHVQSKKWNPLTNNLEMYPTTANWHQ